MGRVQSSRRHSNVADDRSLCDFYFPSIVMTEDTVIGINCGGEDHAKVKETRIKIEEMFVIMPLNR